MKNFMTSDIHFGHKNIIKYCDRPTTVENMDQWLIDQINSKVCDDDIVYHIGDISLKRNLDYILSVLLKLNGKWKFVLGNHDDEDLINKICEMYPDKFENLGWYHVVKLSGRKFILHHFPHRAWQDSRHGSINVHGHCHGSLKGKEYPNQIDVGIDAVDGFVPLEVEEIIRIVTERNPSKKFIDHHEGQKTGTD